MKRELTSRIEHCVAQADRNRRAYIRGPATFALMCALGFVLLLAESRGQEPNDSAEDAIRLIIRADDMGAAHGMNEACISSCTEGIARSVEVIVPGPWFMQAVKRLRENPAIDVGVHLDLTSEWDLVKWGPIAKNVPSLTNSLGHFHPTTRQRQTFPPNTGFLECGWQLDEVERELRAQIETALAHLPNVSHLSAHMGTATSTPELRRLVDELAREYALPVRIEGLQRARGFSGSNAAEKEASLVTLLEGLKPGLWMLVEHPGLDTPEMRALGHIGSRNVAASRAAVTHAFTSEKVKQVVRRRGIQLVSYADVLGKRATNNDGTLDIYWTDVEGGAATLIVTPAGESILIDTGNPGERDSGRIHKTVTEVAGLTRIDHLIITHFDGDHYGGTADLAKRLEIRKVYDPGLPRDNPRVMRRLDAYLKATEGKRTVLKPGDRIPLKTVGATPLTLDCLAAAQKFVEATAEQKASNRTCSGHVPKAKDTSQNANSVVLRLSFGAFDFLDAADLTWNLEHQLVCPNNLVGKVDVYQVDHHGLDQSNNPVLIRSVEPRVAVMNNGSRKGCEPGTFRALKETPSVQAIFQLHRNVRVGENGNTDPQRIANMEAQCTGEIVKLSVHPSGRKYTVSIPSKNVAETFETKP